MSFRKITIRDRKSDQKLLFIHGFSGNAHATFGMMPAFIAGHSALTEWDIHLFGYPTALRPDITGVWSADPPLASLAAALNEELRRYRKGTRLSFVAHSMGGLILQRALLDGNLNCDVEHVLLFGVPSGGLIKARLGRFFKRQVADMSPKSDFINDLNERRASLFSQPAFGLKVVAGLRDEFVPESSSLDPFDRRFHSRVEGNHLEMVKPEDPDSSSVCRVVEQLTGISLAPTSLSAFRTASPANFGEHPRDLVKRAHGLELAGYEEEAIRVLEEHREVNPYVTAALAGLHKRRWFATDGADPEDGSKALSIYEEAFRRAISEGWLNAAGYAGINSAFMTLALDSAERERAASLAAEALAAKQRAQHTDMWLELVQAEASLHLDKQDQAIHLYARGLPALGAREQALAMKQAIWIARALDEEVLEERLRSLLSLSASC